MKKKYKQFLKSCNADLENQECYLFERNIVDKLIKKKYIRKTGNLYDTSCNGTFLIWLSKKGLRKVKKFQKKDDI